MDDTQAPPDPWRLVVANDPLKNFELVCEIYFDDHPIGEVGVVGGRKFKLYPSDRLLVIDLPEFEKVLTMARVALEGA